MSTKTIFSTFPSVCAGVVEHIPSQTHLYYVNTIYYKGATEQGLTETGHV